MLPKARPTQSHHPAADTSQTSRQSTRSSTFGRRVTSPSHVLLHATRPRHTGGEYSLMSFPLLSPRSLPLQNTGGCVKSPAQHKKNEGLNSATVFLGGGGKGRCKCSNPTPFVSGWVQDLLQSSLEAAGSLTVLQRLKHTQADLEQTHRDTRACHKPELPTAPGAGWTAQPPHRQPWSCCRSHQSHGRAPGKPRLTAGRTRQKLTS